MIADNMGSLLARRNSRQSIHYYLTQIRLQACRRFSERQFAEVAQTFVRLLRVVHKGNAAKILKEMHQIADKVDEMELEDPCANGHREKVANAIRKAADNLTGEKCPWWELRPLLANRPILGHLADALWAGNRKRLLEWTVSRDAVVSHVWGDEGIPGGTVGTNLTRLSKWLGERGVVLETSRRFRSEPPHIECRIPDADEEKIQAVLRKHGLA